MGDFRESVYEIVAQIPKGRVMTYGQIAALAGSPRAARQVGGAAHYGDPDLPWQRVVNKAGGMASGYYGGREQHAADLRAEGIEINDDLHITNLPQILWWPE